MKYCISDPHWGHFNIVDYCLRPFRTTILCHKCRNVDEDKRPKLHLELGCPDVKLMDETLIQNWNSVVKPEDEVFELGDTFFHKDPVVIKSILSRLNGTIYHINGNHDGWLKKNPELGDRFTWVKDYFELKENGRHWVMFHFPLLTWHKAHHGALHIHGHCHSSIDYLNKETRRIDIGVDNKIKPYFPLSLDEIAKLMESIKFTPVDHHTGHKEM